MNQVERCCICGKETDVNEETALLDGAICRRCAKGLSPWFHEREDADTAEIREQLRLRETNRERLRNFHPTRKFGDDTLVVVDDKAGTFVVTESKDLQAFNPEVLSLEDVMDCGIEQEEEREEIGPKRYQYRYILNLYIDVDHPYLSHLYFPLNREPLVYESRERSFLGFGGFDPSGEPDYQALEHRADVICAVLNREEEPDDGTHGVLPGEFSGSDDGRLDAGTGETVTCPWCGSSIPMTGNRCCPCCGGTL